MDMTITADMIISRATEVLSRDGWCQGSWDGPDGTHCASGALHVAVRELYNLKDGELGAAKLEISSIREAFDRLWHNEQVHGNLLSWNDEPGRTEDEVLRLFKNA